MPTGDASKILLRFVLTQIDEGKGCTVANLLSLFLLLSLNISALFSLESILLSCSL